MSRVVHLRVLGIAGNVAYLTYGVSVQAWPVFATELVLLPLNALRLWQFVRLLRAVRSAPATSDMLLQHAAQRLHFLDGCVIVTEGARTTHLTLILSGAARGAGDAIHPGSLTGDALPFHPYPVERE